MQAAFDVDAVYFIKSLVGLMITVRVILINPGAHAISPLYATLFSSVVHASQYSARIFREIRSAEKFKLPSYFST